MLVNDYENTYAQNCNRSTSTQPLHVITQYSQSHASTMQSPNRPKSLGLCLSNAQNNSDLKNYFLGVRNNVSQDNSTQAWTIKSVDTCDFEKLLGQIGNNGSTPVTPTSFLNPNNITEDQEMFAE